MYNSTIYVLVFPHLNTVKVGKANDVVRRIK